MDLNVIIIMIQRLLSMIIYTCWDLTVLFMYFYKLNEAKQSIKNKKIMRIKIYNILNVM